jgi:hypothetical protein
MKIYPENYDFTQKEIDNMTAEEQDFYSPLPENDTNGPPDEAYDEVPDERMLDDNLEPGVKQKYRFEGGKFTPDTQPRDAAGRFRTVLARLKIDLGAVGSDRALEKITEVENLDFTGNYGEAAKAAGDLIDIIDRLDTKALNPDSISNVRESSRELGKTIANLPFAFGEDAKKIRFSDVPPALRDLIEDMITRVEAKIGPEDAAIATKEIKSFMSGQEFYSQSDISSQMAMLLRLLT